MATAGGMWALLSPCYIFNIVWYSLVRMVHFMHFEGPKVKFLKKFINRQHKDYAPVICNHVPSRAGKSGDIDFSICKAQVKSLHCRDFVFVKSLLKVPAPRNYFLIHWHLSGTPAINLLQSRTDKIKNKSPGIWWHSSVQLEFFPSEAWQLINSIWLQSFILLKRDWLLVILN